MATKDILDECGTIEDNATELRELISQISDGSTILSDKEDRVFELIDGMKDAVKDMENRFDSVTKELDEANDRITAFERDARGDDGDYIQQIEGTTISFSSSNFQDAQIMDALANCLNDSSGVKKLDLLNILENLPTNLAFKKVA